MDAADQDDNDQQPDFRLLLTNARSQSSSQALPSKESKSTQQPVTVLEDQLDAYFQIIAEERRGAERTFSRAVFESDLGLFRLTVNKGTQFVSMGHTLRGQIYLFPEEALYLVDRGSLLAEQHGLEMTVQEMWSVYFTYAHVSYQDQGSQCAHQQDSTLAMDSWIIGTWRNAARVMVSRIGVFLEPLDIVWARTIRRPLVAHNDRLNYDQILQKLQVIPAIRLAHNAQDDGTIQQQGDRQAHGRIKRDADFEVYKPVGGFKKRQPGSPDYRVVVTRSSAPLPSLADLRGYMDGQFDPASEPPNSNVAPSAASGKGKRPKAPDWPQVLFAVVDGGQVSFMNIYNTKAVP